MKTNHEQQVRELEEALALAEFQLESLNSVVLRWDPRGYVTYLNRFGLDLFGFPADEIIGRSILDSIVPASESSGRDLQEMIEDLLQHPEKYESNENENVCKDGSRVWMLWRNRAIRGEEGELREILTVGVDITKRKLLEGELLKTKKRMQQELKLGGKIQLEMLPKTFTGESDDQRLSLYATLQPARELGGDFYDFFYVDDNRLLFCVGDVSDKGVPSALFMVMAKTLIRVGATQSESPAAIVTLVNDDISYDNPSCMFVTLFVGIIDIRTGTLRFCNAGHNPPYVIRKNGQLDRLDNRHGPAVGAMVGLPYAEDQTQLDSGDSLVAYTDGVTEAFGEAGQMYDEERLVHLLRSSASSTPREIVDSIVASVSSFAGSTNQSDDITLLAIRAEA
jgi:PAS domain S-box-containing protein